MNEPFSIVPPPELVTSLRNSAPHGIRDAGVTRELWLINHAYAAGADQELEACCEWLAKPEVALTGKGPGDLRAALAQPKPVAPKPVVDYSRVPEIATEAQIRAAAQYLVKKRHCDGDLIPAIEYAIARWGTPANTTNQEDYE